MGSLFYFVGAEWVTSLSFPSIDPRSRRRAGVASLFGLVFWIVADHEFAKSEVGHAIAATNAMQLFGTTGMFGLGTMMIGEQQAGIDALLSIATAVFPSEGTQEENRRWC
jgi:hypothetical protein